VTAGANSIAMASIVLFRKFGSINHSLCTELALPGRGGKNARHVAKIIADVLQAPKNKLFQQKCLRRQRGRRTFMFSIAVARWPKFQSIIANETQKNLHWPEIIGSRKMTKLYKVTKRPENNFLVF
jgi:hypothetical protein